MHCVTLIPGDGIGPEVAAATRRILDATGVGLDWEEIPAPPLTDRRQDHHLHPDWLDSIRRNRVALKGPMTTPVAEGHRSLNVALRQALELYAKVRPVQNLPGLKSRFDNVNSEFADAFIAALESTRARGSAPV